MRTQQVSLSDFKGLFLIKKKGRKRKKEEGRLEEGKEELEGGRKEGREVGRREGGRKEVEEGKEGGKKEGR